jgi:hypothetical protein
MEEKASDPAAWPHPFTDGGNVRTIMHHLGDGHFVRAIESFNVLEIAS